MGGRVRVTLGSRESSAAHGSALEQQVNLLRQDEPRQAQGVPGGGARERESS